MLDLAKLTAAPIPIEVGGKQYNLAPLTLGHLGQLEQWAREQILADLPKKLNAIGKAKLDKAEAERLRAQAVKETDIASRDPLEVARMMDTCAGQRQAFALALRACQPIDDKDLDAICSVSGLTQIREWVRKTYETEEAKSNPQTAQTETTPNA